MDERNIQIAFDVYMQAAGKGHQQAKLAVGISSSKSSID
jgi:hypothetical protein